MRGFESRQPGRTREHEGTHTESLRALADHDLLSLRDLKIAVQPDFERGAFIEHQVVTRFESGVSPICGAGTRAGGSTVFSALMGSCGCAFAGPYYYGLSDFFFGHAFTTYLAFLTDLAQSVFARNSSYGCDEWNPPVLSFDFVETEKEASVQSGFDGTHVSFDLLALLKRHAIWREQGLGQPCTKMVARLYRVSVETVG
jgi:hypothetical protein